VSRKIVTVLVLVPLGLVIILFAVANRHDVTLSFDPFGSDPGLARTLPLFAVMLAALIVGVIIGGIAVWLRHYKWRRAARRLESEARALRTENEALKRRAGEPALPPAAGNVTMFRHPPAA
jgi:uncharacterized integral membrane protein